MKITNYIIILLLSLLVYGSLQAQDKCPGAESSPNLAWVEPEKVDISSEMITLFVDLSKDPNCDKLVGTSGPLYIWTWGPGDPVDGNGTWGGSLEDNIMTQVDGNIWSFTMLAPDFYGVDAEEIYEGGICFLVKEKDGGSGGDCSVAGGEFKTADLHVPIQSPFETVRKVYSLPDILPNTDTILTRRDDYFTLFYDNALEEKASMMNISEMYVYARLTGTNGSNYNVTSLSQVGNNPDLKMKDNGNGLFSFTFIPKDFYAETLPEGVDVARMRFQLITWPLCGSDCAVDGDFFFSFKCED